jgi:hypothetical protein
MASQRQLIYSVAIILVSVLLFLNKINITVESQKKGDKLGRPRCKWILER